MTREGEAWPTYTDWETEMAVRGGEEQLETKDRHQRGNEGVRNEQTIERGEEGGRWNVIRQYLGQLSKLLHNQPSFQVRCKTELPEETNKW